MRTNDFLKIYPPESHSWAGKVTFSFSHPTNGWIQFAILCTTYVQGVILNLSDVFDPFPGLFRWLSDIAQARLPSEFVVDEEGQEKVFRASPINNDEFLFEIGEMRYGEDPTAEQPLFMYAQVSRHQFLADFLKS
jgi:hypothetical protein